MHSVPGDGDWVDEMIKNTEKTIKDTTAVIERLEASLEGIGETKAPPPCNVFRLPALFIALTMVGGGVVVDQRWNDGALANKAQTQLEWLKPSSWSGHPPVNITETATALTVQTKSWEKIAEGGRFTEETLNALAKFLGTFLTDHTGQSASLGVHWVIHDIKVETSKFESYNVTINATQILDATQIRTYTGSVSPEGNTEMDTLLRKLLAAVLEK